MTYEEIMDKWGDTTLKFSRYYKYVFYYTGTTENGYNIEADYGGDSSEIYRLEVVNNEEIKLVSLYPNRIEVYKDGKGIAAWSDY